MNQSRHVVILGAGKAARDTLPPAMVQVDKQSRVLDWLLGAFSVLPSARVSFVSGFGAAVVMEQYPDIQFVFNPAWDTTGPAKSLALGIGECDRTTYVSYSDVVFLSDTVRRLDEYEADFVLAVDSTWRERYERRSSADLEVAEKVVVEGARVLDIGKHLPDAHATSEFAGLMKVSASAASQVGEMVRSGAVLPDAGLPELIRVFLRRGLDIAALDITGGWAELNAPQDLARFVLGTKAESLDRLQPLVRTGHIGTLYSFAHATWKRDRTGTLARITETFASKRVIVRSSALSEDAWYDSAAGAYDSVSDVPADDPSRLGDAIDDVFDSYANDDRQNQVLVQEMLRNVRVAGVVLTRTNTDGAPYYVINFDDTSRRTDTVTSGKGDGLRTVYLHRGSRLRGALPTELDRLMEVVYELERLVGHDSLDIEFAFTADGRAHVLQVRPIVVGHQTERADDARVARGIENAQRFVADLGRPSPFLVGKTTQLSVMSDWNPAEMIGVKPRRLAFSLYRHLITDEVWATQRVEYGYRDVRPCNLIVDVLGHPYVDVRATFNSFIPADLPDAIAERLIEHYLERLLQRPELHDKVEFDILFTCLPFDFDDKVQRLEKAGISRDDIAQLRTSLLNITNRGMRRIENDEAQLQLLDERFKRIRDIEMAPLDKVYLLLEDAKRYGVLPFAHMARSAFVAMSLLRSLTSTGLITVAQSEDFLESIRFAASDVQLDAYAVKTGAMDFQTFAEKYGHLRPGTYDITSPRYDSAPEQYLRPTVENASPPPPPVITVWDAGTRQRIETALRSMGFEVDASRFEDFLQRAIAMREHGKFMFTRNISAGLEEIAEFGAMRGISRHQLANIRLGDLLQLRAARADVASHTLRELADAGMKAFSVTRAVCLPGQISHDTDLRCFEQAGSEPNFVGRQRVQAAVVSLTTDSSPDLDLAAKIVAIPNADPGFDWIFTRNIAGLITMYGGANSHMAIRAAQLKLPAAIGVGRALFDRVAAAEIVDLDCASHRVEVVRRVEARADTAGRHR